jgi:hypothetical protein
MQRANYLIFIAALPACTTLPNGHAWGQDATLLPGWEKVQTAAIDAARSPMTWAPLLAAGLLQIDNADENLSDWASDDTPIFGSRQTADTISTDLMRASVGLYAVTALATPSGDEHWLENKAKGLGIGLAAEVTTAGLTEGFKGLAAALTVGTAYARVEARQHFPSDVLAGAALGHFIGVFADEAFLGSEQRYRVLPMVDVSRSGFLIGINGHF